MASVLSRRARPSNSGGAVRSVPRRWRWMSLTALTLAVGVLWAAPIIIAKTPLRQGVMAMLVEDLHGTATAGSMSLGWFSPPVIEDVELLDANGESLLRVAKISGDRSLWALLADRSDLGTLRVEGAELHLVLRTDGSNLEDVLRPLLESEDESAGPIDLYVEVVDATIAVESAIDQRRWRIERFNVRVDLTEAGGQAVSITASGVVPDGQTTGRFAVGVLLNQALTDDRSASPGGSMKLKADAMPVEMFEPLVRRFAPRIQLAGRLSSDVEVHWTNDTSPSVEKPSVEIKGRVDVDDLRLAADWLGDDVVRLRRLSLPCDISYHDGQINLRALAIDCDVGRLTLSGRAQLDRLGVEGLLDVLLTNDYRAAGEIDLARLAEALPKTLRIKQGTQIDGGRLRFDLSRRTEEARVRYQGSLSVEDLSAKGPGGPILWQRPIELTLSASENAGELRIEQLLCRSDFLAIQVSGRLDDLTASADVDLSAFVEQLGQIVDLGELRLAGRGHGQLRIRRRGHEEFAASGRVEVDQFQFAPFRDTPFRDTDPQHRSWSEDRLILTLEAVGNVADGRPTRVQSATATITVGDERLSVKLTHEVSDVGRRTTWPVELELTTRLVKWLPRLDPWLSLRDGPLREWTVEGDCRLKAVVECSASGIHVRESRLQIESLTVVGDGLWIVEPRVEVQLSGTWDAASGRIDLNRVNLTSRALSVGGENLSISPDKDAARPWRLAGTLRFQADAKRLQAWFRDARQPDDYDLAGQLSGVLRVSGDEDSTSVDLQMVAEDLVLVRWMKTDAHALPLAVRPAGNTGGGATPTPVNRLRTPKHRSETLWRETKAVLKIAGRYLADSDVLEIENVEVRGNAVGLQGQGKISALGQQRQLELRGQFDYDLAKFTPLLQAYAGAGVVLHGRNSGTFSFAGPLRPPAMTSSNKTIPRTWIELLSADVQLGWQQIDAYGLVVQPGTIKARLSAGQIRLAPLDLKVNQGRITAAPTVLLSGERVEQHGVLLALGKGPLAHNVMLTKEVCAGGLRFIAPALADAAEAQGRFSIDLDAASIPLSRPEEAELSGRLTVHSVQITPGPLMRQALLLAAQLESVFRGGGLAVRAADTTVRMKKNQQVRFRMVNGRVYHQGLELMAAGAVIRTSGSVGIDETLDLVVEVPIQEKWIGRDSRFARWRNEVIRIPIGGTLSRPTVDTSVLRRLVAQLAQQAGEKFFQDQINKGLEKLLRPRPAKQ